MNHLSPSLPSILATCRVPLRYHIHARRSRPSPHHNLKPPNCCLNMKTWGAAASALLLALAGCRVVPTFPQQYTATNIATLIKVFGAPSAVTSDTGSIQLAPRADPPPPKRPKPNPPSPPAEPATEAPAVGELSEWNQHVCRGRKLD